MKGCAPGDRRALVVLAGCGGSDAPPRPWRARRRRAERTAPPRRAGGDRPGRGSATSTVRAGDVLDAAGAARPPRRGRRDARAARRGRGRARRPVFVVLSGGPGQPGVPFLDRARQWLGPGRGQVRMVAIDQRGTGANALRCPALQRADGRLGPDAADARGGHAAARARSGDRAALLQHRGHRRGPRGAADRAERRQARRSTAPPTGPTPRSATRSPTRERVRGLVLDSVVPVENVSLLSEVPIKATRRVLGEAGDQGRWPRSSGRSTTAPSCSTC